MKPTVLDLENELKVLQAEASKVPLLEQALNEIQATVKELASTIDFLTSDHTSTTPAPPKSIPTDLTTYDTAKRLYWRTQT